MHGAGITGQPYVDKLKWILISQPAQKSASNK